MRSFEGFLIKGKLRFWKKFFDATGLRLKGMGILGSPDIEGRGYFRERRVKGVLGRSGL